MVDQFKTLGKYHVLERLAHTPLAEVYKVKTVGIAGFEKVQVLYRVLPEYSDDQRFFRAFIDQAKVAFSLNHRNIVQVFEFGKVDAELFLATEYIPGVNLGEIIERARRRGERVPVGLTCYLMGEVAAGLEYAHQKTDQFGRPLEVIHCDLSPVNVACSFEGSVKILNFGMARVAYEAVPAEAHTDRLPRHLSPEQVRGEPVDTLSDIFSFGATLWELLTGAPLFTGDSRPALHQAVLDAPIVPPRSINPEVPPGLDEAAMRCLERVRERRFSSANDLQLELHRIQREVGAVIGSRALSSYLQELMPESSDTRDVRQQEVSQEAPLPPKPEPSYSRAPDLIAAAAELAQRKNPPARRVDTTERRGPHRRRRRVARPRDAQRELESQPSLPEARIAGVLRPSRHADEVVPSPRRRGPSDDGASWTGDFEELTDTASASIKLPLTEGEPDDEPITDVPYEERVPTDDSERPGGPTGEQPAVLGERKRFIAVAVALSCVPEARQETLGLVADIAYKRDGLIHEQSNGHLTVLFGLPAYHDHDIVSAVRFAIDAEEAVSHLLIDRTDEGIRGGSGVASTPRGTVRFGIRAGTARMSGLPSKEGYQVLGNALPEAGALADHAATGQICLAGAAVRMAAQHYRMREVDPMRRHGKRVRCYRVTGARPAERQRPSLSYDEPLIGREIDIKALRSAWREAVTFGEQRALLIMGDAGIGKTRLVDDFLSKHCADARVVATAATPHRVETPYSVIVNLLRSVTGVWSAAGPRARTRLVERLGRILNQTDRRGVDEALDALTTVLDPGDDLGADSGVEFARDRVYRALRLTLHRAADQRPLVVMVDDLHWSDSASIECLRTLVSRPEDATGPLLLLVTARSEEGADIGTFFEETPASLIELGELDEDHRQRLIVNILGERASPQVVAEVERRAGGAPFLIRELCQAIRELDDPNATAEIPDNVQGLIASRVDRLPAHVKLVLQYATVIGPTFREAILTTLLARNAARSLGQLRRRGFLVPSTNMAVPYASVAGMSDQFERQWTFRHVLVQEVLYQALSSADRRQLHRRVGEIMAVRATRGSSDPPAEIARHLELGGAAEEAGPYYLRAAHEAAAAYANQEAAELYDRALELLGDEQMQYSALAGRERVMGRLGLADRQAADLRALRKLCGDDPRRLADLRSREAVRLLRLGELYRALEAAELAEAAAVEAEDRILHGEALRLRGEAYGRLNDLPRAIDAANRALEIFQQQESAAHQVRARLGLGRIHLVQANYDEAFQHYEAALALITRTADRWQERVLRNDLAVVHACRGEFSRALEEAMYSLKLCLQFSDRAREGDNCSVIGIVYYHLGMYDKARQYIESALGAHRETGSQWSESDTLIYAGLLAGAVGEPERALELLEQAKTIADRMGAKSISVNARNAIAGLLCDRNLGGDAQLAVAAASEAMEIARNAALVVGEIPALARAARAHAITGNLDEARALSRRAIELLEEQRNIETPEEEIYYTRYRVLVDAEPEIAAQFLERAHSCFVAKMAMLDDPEARQSFSEAVPMNVAICRDYNAERSVSAVDTVE